MSHKTFCIGSILLLVVLHALLGSPPKEFLDREMEARSWKWEPPIENPDGRVCTSVNEYFGSPFFDSHGKRYQDYQSTLLTISKASSYIKIRP